MFPFILVNSHPSYTTSAVVYTFSLTVSISYEAFIRHRKNYKSLEEAAEDELQKALVQTSLYKELSEENERLRAIINSQIKTEGEAE